MANESVKHAEYVLDQQVGARVIVLVAGNCVGRGCMDELRKIRDPIHGFICLSGKECDIIDSRIFQRLRGIRQLAFAHLVYPGAVHTRFEHSLGVCHVARRLGEALNLDEEHKILIRLTGLLHDLGHGPFSHVSERALEMFADREKLKSRMAGRQIHELITEDIIQTDAELGRKLSVEDRDKIIRLLSPEGYGEPVQRSIISGPLDADKQDYLLRDSYFCGVKYGLYDIDQLLRQLRSVEDPADGSMRLMISPDGIHAVEQFVFAKYFINEQVYRHRVRLITDQMLIRSIVLGIEIDGIEELRRLFCYDGSSEFVKYYSKYDDTQFLYTFLNDTYKELYCYQILKRLTERRLLKRVFDMRLNELPKNCRDQLSNICRPDCDNRKLRTKVERNICIEINETLGHAGGKCEEIDSKLVIVYAYDVKSVRAQARTDEKFELVDRRDQPRHFDEESSLFRSIDEKSNEEFVEVYAPVPYDNPKKRREIQNKLAEPIIRAISDSFSEGGSHADP